MIRDETQGTVYRGHSDPGVAILMTVFVVAIALAVALGVANIFFREVRITRGALPSFIAFYTADTGAECALFGHVQQHLFDPPFQPSVTLRCDGQNITAVFNGVDTYNLNFDVTNESNVAIGCARVKITRRTVSGFGLCMRIDAYGENQSCSGPANADTTERGLLVRDPETCPI